MIIVRLSGGLGNQMFQYAFGVQLAKASGQKLFLDISFFTEVKNDSNTPRKYALDQLNISHKNILPSYKSKSYRFLHKVGLNKFFSPKMHFIYEKKSRTYNEFTIRKNNNYIFTGYWQSFKYFDYSKPDFQKQFKPLFLSDAARNYKSMITDHENSISIHIRRGDYVSNKNARLHHGLISLNYYHAALNYFKNKNINGHFFIFSDDINWCKSNLDLNNATFIEDISEHDSIFLMSVCRHNIIANSTFSWWGAYLNENEDKIVCYPRNWTTDDHEILDDLIPKEWIRIE